ncbi:FAD-dependent monooxygenase [Streptomyces sp. NPDC018947]|uniref:FAD-dependent monooxygenase n=1 Tax=Streptomyces sp. NPDC018947 TaxID=3365054 RepID=UPI0037A5D7B0
MSTDTDVLIVGAGPTGLFAACELIRRGVRVRLVDRADGPSTVPKALALWPRALDLLEDLGVRDELRDAAVPVAGFSYFSDGRPLATFTVPDRLRPLHLPQYETERLLTERLHELGGKIERGVRLLTFDDVDFGGRIDSSDGVTAVLEHGDAGVERVRASFVIGADGASGSTRGALGIGFQGSTYELRFALIDARVEGTLPPDQLLYYQAPTGTLMIAPLPDGVFRILAVMPPGDQRVDVAMMQRLLDERGPGGVRITEPVWQTLYRVHARQATEYQRGRVFLAGDAAHVHSPAGGQGMNNGLQDALNLAWKLAAVVHGESPVSVLESYTPERAEATTRIVADTDRQTRAWMADSRARITLRDAAFRLAAFSGVVPRYVFPVMAGRRVTYTPTRPTQTPARPGPCRMARRRPARLRVGMVFPREVAVAYGFAGPKADPAAWTVVVRAGGTHGDLPERIARVTARWPRLRHVRLHPGDAEAATGCAAPGFHLVRPDGHIAAHGHAEDLPHLTAELARFLHPAGTQ